MADLTQQARERFEAWATSQHLPIKRHRWGEYKVEDTEAAWEAWQAALRAAPEGFVLVPAVPTVFMLWAADEADDEAFSHGAMHGADNGSIYRTMLAARPQEASDA